MNEATSAKGDGESLSACGHLDCSAPSHRVMLFHGHSNPELAAAIAKYLDIPLGRALVSRFANGEIRVKIEETVRGSRVFVIQPTCGNVNDSLMELLIMIDALSRASAYSICAVIPYYGYAKQEKKTSGREPISAKLVANLLTVAGADRVITVDLHAAAIQGFFDIPCDNLKALPTIADHYRELGLHREGLVVVSPDAGGVARATDLAEHLGAQLAIIFKRRPEPDKTQVIEIVGDIEGKNCIVVDDMISTGQTMIHGVEALKARGAKKIYAAVTHSIMAGDAVNMIENSPLEELVVTDTIPVSPEALKMSKLKVLSLAPLLGEAIRRTHFNQSVSELFL
ncbi:ribose-phosphate pyrophosphokinase [bacterium]|nr:ribose-phosphate pyrophosphokinase [bacterium]